MDFSAAAGMLQQLLPFFSSSKSERIYCESQL